MKTIKDKQILVGADFAGFPLKEAVVAHLKKKGWTVNVLAMGAFYVAPQMGKDIADAYLSHSLGDGYEWWPNFYEFHKLAIDELNAFDYEAYKANGFKLEHLGDYPLELMDTPHTCLQSRRSS